MLPNNPNFSNFSDQAFYALQQRAPPHSQITFQPQPQLIDVAPIEAASAGTSTCQQRKRTCRADRHSKIRTAQGERDRRMRLSVQVAQQFFALQDCLGFDKASKTIDWLFTQAKDSINQLSSGSSYELSKEEIPTDDMVITNQSPMSDYDPVHATAIVQKSIKAGEFQPTAKDLRAKARARARVRAREKKVASSQVDQLVPARASADAPTDENFNGMEYYYVLLNEILNGGFCSVDIEDNGGTISAGVPFN